MKITKENELLKRLEAVKRNYEKVEKEDKNLKRDLDNLIKKVDEIQRKFDHKEIVEKENKKEIKHLKQHNEYLDQELGKIKEKLDGKEARLALGQIAWLLESEIWKNVLPREEMVKTGILYTMEQYLNDGDDDETEAAGRRCDILQTGLGWKEKRHKVALRVLKDLRIDNAHAKKVDLDETKKLLMECQHVAGRHVKMCQEIIEMVTKVMCINQRNGKNDGSHH